MPLLAQIVERAKVRLPKLTSTRPRFIQRGKHDLLFQLQTHGTGDALRIGNCVLGIQLDRSIEIRPRRVEPLEKSFPRRVRNLFGPAVGTRFPRPTDPVSTPQQPGIDSTQRSKNAGRPGHDVNSRTKNSRSSASVSAPKNSATAPQSPPCCATRNRLASGSSSGPASDNPSLERNQSKSPIWWLPCRYGSELPWSKTNQTPTTGGHAETSEKGDSGSGPGFVGTGVRCCNRNAIIPTTYRNRSRGLGKRSL